MSIASDGKTTPELGATPGHVEALIGHTFLEREILSTVLQRRYMSYYMEHSWRLIQEEV